MPASGGFTHFKADIFKPTDYQYFDEVKNQETVSLWKWWSQASGNASGNQIPVLHITRNNSPVLSVLRMEDYMNLRAEVKQLETEVAKLKGTRDV